MATANESRRVLYSGRVQGVGFRYTAIKVAQTYAVKGFVRNLSDGRVELLAEGSPLELSRFLAAVAEAMAGYIEEQQVEKGPATNQFTAFEIAR